MQLVFCLLHNLFAMNECLMLLCFMQNSSINTAGLPQDMDDTSDGFGQVFVVTTLISSILYFYVYFSI